MVADDADHERCAPLTSALTARFGRWVGGLVRVRNRSLRDAWPRPRKKLHPVSRHGHMILAIKREIQMDGDLLFLRVNLGDLARGKNPSAYRKTRCLKAGNINLDLLAYVCFGHLCSRHYAFENSFRSLPAHQHESQSGT